MLLQFIWIQLYLSTNSDQIARLLNDVNANNKQIKELEIQILRINERINQAHDTAKVGIQKSAKLNITTKELTSAGKQYELRLCREIAEVDRLKQGIKQLQSQSLDKTRKIAYLSNSKSS